MELVADSTDAETSLSGNASFKSFSGVVEEDSFTAWAVFSACDSVSFNSDCNLFCCLTAELEPASILNIFNKSLAYSLAVFPPICISDINDLISFAIFSLRDTPSSWLNQRYVSDNSVLILSISSAFWESTRILSNNESFENFLFW